MSRYLKLINILIFVIFINFPAYSAYRLLDGSFISLENKLVTLIDSNGQKKIVSINMELCDKESSFNVDNSTLSFQVSDYVSAYIITGGKELSVYNLQNGKKEQSFNDFMRAVSIIRQSEMGEYIAVSDTLSVKLYKFGKKGLEEKFSRENFSGVTAVYPDIESKTVFVAEKNGSLSLWNFDGKIRRSLKYDFTINDILSDTKTGKLLAVTSSGLYNINKESYVSEKMLNGRIHSVYVSPSGSLDVMSDKGFTVYDYPSMRQLMIVHGADGKILKNDSKMFKGFLSVNYLRLYEVKSGSNKAVIAFENNDMVNFYPPERMYGENISYSFIKNNNTDYIYNENIKKIVCNSLQSMFTGVYFPEDVSYDKVAEPKINMPYDTKIKEVSEPAKVAEPKVEFSGVAPKEPKVDTVKNNIKLSIPKDVKAADVQDNTKKPVNPKVKPIDELMASKVPNWIANRKNLPKNNSVGMGTDMDTARKQAESAIKNNAVRDTLLSIVKNKLLSGITDNEVKKRILWQSASGALNSMGSNFIVADTWVSPAGQNFIHLVLDNRTLLDTAEKKLELEIMKYNKLGREKYMQEKANSFE